MPVKHLAISSSSTVVDIRAMTYLGGCGLTLHDFPVVDLPVGDDTECRVVDPCPKGDIIIHQVCPDLLLRSEIKQLELTTSYGYEHRSIQSL